MYKMSRAAMWKWIRSKTKKLDIQNYAAGVKVYFILDILKKEIKATIGIKLCEAILHINMLLVNIMWVHIYWDVIVILY